MVSSSKLLWISTQTASLLTGKVTKTIYRWADDGAIQTQQEGGRLQIDLESLGAQIEIPIDDELRHQVRLAEEGRASAMLEIGLLFLQAQLPELAFRWFEQAARKGHLDAMDWLSICYAEGIGVAANGPLALRWLGEAAAHGHLIAKAKVQALASNLLA
ncbi:MAG: SEL1-like repeat protein [Acidithiobacillus sp.]|nr:SEL1-like repeat protein [Acidithiobacillus sp.]